MIFPLALGIMKLMTFLAATSISPAILPRSVFGANKKLNIGFVGMGGQIQGHVRNTLQLGHNVVAFCDVDPNQTDRSRNRHKDKARKINAYMDYRQMLENEKSLDAVVIGTPDHWHAIQTVEAVNSGKDVYCEKPLTHNVHESVQVMKAVAKKKAILQTGSMQRSSSLNLSLSFAFVNLVLHCPRLLFFVFVGCSL